MPVNNIIIVGGGTSGWMCASTLISCFPDKKVTLVESPNIPTIGVGESTLSGLNNWCKFLGIQESDFMPLCDANYKFSIRFEDFYLKGSGGFHYPFGEPDTVGTISGFNDWHFKRLCDPENNPVSDYADCFFPLMAMVNHNKINKDRFNFEKDNGYQFDATKFGLWLKDNFCKPRGVNHILAEVKSVEQDESGIRNLLLDDGRKLSADLFIDCTGFKSVLLGEALQEPFESLEKLLPNNSAWVTRISYEDKESEMVLYTNCCAIGNGWVWTVPLWSRMGSGYVYSDRYISDEDALQEFKDHLELKGYSLEGLQFRKLKMRTGINKRLWVKNVCAIGSSGGFIEPLESGGLFTIHEFLVVLVRILGRGNISQWDKNEFNFVCKDKFREFSEFVALHYALSHRDDTEYWRDNLNRDYSEWLDSDSRLPSIEGFEAACFGRFRSNRFRSDGGLHCIAAGMNWFPTDKHALDYGNCESNYDVQSKYQGSFLFMDKRRIEWSMAASKGMSPYLFLKEMYEGHG